MGAAGKVEGLLFPVACHGGAKTLKGWSSLRKTGLDLLFPPRCLLCYKFLYGKDRAICRDCLEEIQYLQPPICRCCGTKVAGGAERQHLCGDCLRHPPPFNKALAIIHYDQPAAALLHRLKYAGDTTVLQGFSRILEEVPLLEIPHAEIIIPVPLHRRRLQERGLNQSVLLSRLLFPSRLQDIRTDLLRRTRNTPAQTSLDGDARRKNLRAAFVVTGKNLVQGKSVCLVDDVFTTGTTVSECSRVLMAAGVAEVTVLTMARVATPL